MDNAGYAALQIIPSFDGMESRLERGVNGPMRSAGSRGGRVFGDSAGRSIASSIATHTKHAAYLAAGVLSAAAVAGGALLRGSFAEAREAQKAGALTVSTLKATGNAANVSAKDIGRLSNSLSRKAAIDDEVIQSGLNMLLTFKNVRNEAGKGNDIFDKAGKTITDMAAAMAASSGGEVDLKSASIQVGKALNDPIKGISALSRVGVTFTQQQKDQIAALVATGDTMGAQKIILHELTSEFGGAAASQATDSDRVAVAWGNMEEKLGIALLPLLKDFNRFLLRDAIPTFEDWVDTFQKDGVPALKHFFDKAKPVAEDMLPKLADVLGTTRDLLADAAPYAKDLVDAFIDMPDWAKKAIIGGGLAAFAANKTGVSSLLGSAGKTGGGLAGLISKAKPLPVYVVNAGFGGAGGIGADGVPIVGGGRKPKGGRIRLGGRFGPAAGLLASLGLGVAAGATAGGESGSNQAALSNTLTGASIGSLFGPVGTGVGAGYGALYDAYNSTPTRDLPISEYERNFAAQNPTYGLTPDAKPGDNPFSAGIDELQKKIHAVELHKIQPKFDILGLVEAEGRVNAFRERASQPVMVPIVAKIDAAIQTLFSEAFGGGRSGPGSSSSDDHRAPTSGRTVGGINVHGNMLIQAQDYRDMQRQLQQRSQQTALGGIGVLPS